MCFSQLVTNHMKTTPTTNTALGFLIPLVPSDNNLWCRVSAMGSAMQPCKERGPTVANGSGLQKSWSREQKGFAVPTTTSPYPQCPTRTHCWQHCYQHKDDSDLLSFFFFFPTVLCVWFRWTTGVSVRQNNQHLCKYLRKPSTVSKGHCFLCHFGSKCFFLSSQCN